MQYLTAFRRDEGQHHELTEKEKMPQHKTINMGRSYFCKKLHICLYAHRKYLEGRNFKLSDFFGKGIKRGFDFSLGVRSSQRTQCLRVHKHGLKPAGHPPTSGTLGQPCDLFPRP